MASSSESLEYWRTFFGSATDDIFQVIENSIHIASQDHPAEFSGRCEQLIKNEEEGMRVEDLLTNWQQQVFFYLQTAQSSFFYFQILVMKSCVFVWSSKYSDQF